MLDNKGATPETESIRGKITPIKSNTTDLTPDTRKCQVGCKEIFLFSCLTYFTSSHFFQLFCKIQKLPTWELC